MKCLYITSANVAGYSENSNAYQQPYNLCKNTNCTIILPKDYNLNPEIVQLSEEVVKIRATKFHTLTGNFLHSKDLHLLSTLSESDFDFVLSDFSEWSIAITTNFLRFKQLPWYMIMWDPPFGNRYEVKKGLFYSLEHKVRRSLFNRRIRKVKNCFCFINSGMLKSEGLQFQQSSQLVNGVDLNIVEKLSKEVNSAPIAQSICAIGRVRFDKGVLNILQAFELIAKSYPGATLTFIGQIDGTDAEKEQIENLLKEHSATSRIKVTGRLPFTETIKTAMQHEVGLHAYSSSQYLFWNHVLKVGEYQASGVVPVAVSYPGTNDIIVDRETGILIPSNSDKHIYEGVDMLFKNREMLVKIRERAKLEVKKRSWDRVTTQLARNIEQDLIT